MMSSENLPEKSPDIHRSRTRLFIAVLAAVVLSMCHVDTVGASEDGKKNKPTRATIMRLLSSGQNSMPLPQPKAAGEKNKEIVLFKSKDGTARVGIRRLHLRQGALFNEESHAEKSIGTAIVFTKNF